MDICGRCGVCHPSRSWCIARTAQCLKCRSLGHFARVCRAADTRKSPSLQKSIKKKRDTERMTAFLRRKDTQNLPFHDLDTDDLMVLSFNSLTRIRTVCNRKCIQEKEACRSGARGLQVSMDFLRLENRDLKVSDQIQKQTIEELKRGHERLKSLLGRKNEKISKLEERIQESVIKQSELIQLLKEWKQKEKDIIVTENLYQCRERALLQKTNNLETKLDKLTQDLLQKDREREISRTQHSKSLQQYRQVLAETKTDLEKLSSYIVNELAPGTGSVTSHSSCSKCGSFRHHTGRFCPANLTGTQCALCNKRGHFTLCCKKLIL